ncbi:hypothetical protein FSP39_022673, partial [Pinctada imbricata]
FKTVCLICALIEIFVMFIGSQFLMISHVLLHFITDKTPSSIEKVEITPCPSQPCTFKHGENVTVNVYFTSVKAAANLTAEIYGVIAGVPVKFNMPDSNGCSGGIKCPIQAEQKYVYSGFFNVLKTYPIDIHNDMVTTLGKDVPTYATVKRWVAEFKRGRHSLDDDPRHGRPVTVVTPEMTNKIHDIVMTDRRVTDRYIASTVGLSQESF